MILRELAVVLASPHFCNSKRYPALLQYIVEATLDGRSESLKERTLGIEVFDRLPSYDTNSDTVVRYTAGEVRKRLSLYYHELEQKPAVQIYLPSGSYVPEFILEEPEDHHGDSAHPSLSADSHSDWPLHPNSPEHPDAHGAAPHAVAVSAGAPSASRWSRTIPWLIVAALVVALVYAGAWKYQAAHPYTPLDDFWSPVLHNQKNVVICSGVVVFNQNAFSGVITAGRDTEYPFVSFQGASSIALLSGLAAKNGASTQLQDAASIPLTALRDQPVIYLGAYNNPWTIRLLEPLPFHFAPETDASIVDRDHPNVHWERDRSLPYSGADDYGLIARFRDTTTGRWVMVVAGLGRNGSEAAADFVTSPRYMQLLRDRVGSDFAAHSVEVILKVNVIEGKTGAPSISAIRVW